MKKFTLFLLALSFAGSMFGQITGTKTIPGDYATIAAAVTALNTSGTAAPGVTFNVAAGHTETSANITFTTTTGSATAPIVFQKSGTGANPLIKLRPGHPLQPTGLLSSLPPIMLPSTGSTSPIPPRTPPQPPRWSGDMLFLWHPPPMLLKT